VKGLIRTALLLGQLTETSNKPEQGSVHCTLYTEFTEAINASQALMA